MDKRPDDNRPSLFSPRRAVEDLTTGPKGHTKQLVGWAIACTAVSWGLYKLPMLTVSVATGETACLLAAGVMLMLGLLPFFRAARATWTDEPDPSIGQSWAIGLTSLAACTGCLWAASQHAMSGYYILTGILIFFAAFLTALFKNADRYLSIPQIAVILGGQAALLVSLLGP